MGFGLFLVLFTDYYYFYHVILQLTLDLLSFFNI